MTNYTATYQAGDVSYAVVDLIVGILAGLFGFISLIVLVMLAKFLKNKGVKM